MKKQDYIKFCPKCHSTNIGFVGIEKVLDICKDRGYHDAPWTFPERKEASSKRSKNLDLSLKK